MEIGISGGGGCGERLIEKAQIAERMEFDLFTLPDSQLLGREVFSSLGVVATETNSIAIGPMVTNPVTRHPSVIASSISTVDEFTGGRAILGIASGDSAVRTLGERPAKLTEMRQSIRTIQSLTSGQRAEYNGQSLQIQWANRKNLPLFWAAEGPKTQRLAGELADIVVLGTGILPELIAEQVERVNEGAHRAGRSPEEVDKWVLARCNVMNDRADAIEKLKSSLAGVAHHSLQFSMEGKSVPDEYREPLETLISKYNTDAGTLPGSPNAELLDQLDLTEYLANRYGVVGTPDDCIRKMEEIHNTGLVDGVFLSAAPGRKREVIQLFGTEVLPSIK